MPQVRVVKVVKVVMVVLAVRLIRVVKVTWVVQVVHNEIHEILDPVGLTFNPISPPATYLHISVQIHVRAVFGYAQIGLLGK